MADVLVGYTRRQICATERGKANLTSPSNTTLPGIEGLDAMPRVCGWSICNGGDTTHICRGMQLRFFQKYDHTTHTGYLRFILFRSS